jgi:hypothetical protein
MQNMERDLRLLKQKIDLLIDGYQVLYMKLEQQHRMLERMNTKLSGTSEPLLDEAGEHKVVRLSDRFLTRVRRNAHDILDPDDKTLA